MPPSVELVDPALGDPLGGARLTLTGAALEGAVVEVGGVACEPVEAVAEGVVRCRAPALAPGAHDVVVATAVGTVSLPRAYEAWSPAELEGARLFDARVGVETDGASTRYEWQRMVAEIAPDWRARDGNTLTYLPSTGRFWMVGGWNGLQVPDGFSEVDPALGLYPPQNTTGEVWSSGDGVSWQLELAHGHDRFERRHVHHTVVWNGSLWMLGGDHHQGFYNHDVVTSADGVNWDVVLGPGAEASPPWAPRGLQISGVYAGKLWTMGGQELVGDPATMRFFNDVWSTDDGVNWTEVLPSGPAGPTRWERCGAADGLVEFQGRMWLVGCGCDTSGSSCGPGDLRAEVWSSADGAVWKRHSDPPWAGKTWHNVVVWDDRLWVLFGFTFGDPANGWPVGNANEAWWSTDGETWESLPPDAAAPGSHAQGVAVRGDELWYAGGNHSFYGGDPYDRSVWRLVPFRGQAVSAWTERASGALTVEPPSDDARPVVVADAFGPGEPGLQFDGSRSVLSLAEPDEQPAGRTVLWVARAPYLPRPAGLDETYAPLGTVVGGVDATGLPRASVGLSDGALVLVNRQEAAGPLGEPLWARVQAGAGLQEGPGAPRLLGMSHALDGTVTAWIDGAEVSTDGLADYASPRAWSQLGGSLEGGYYGPHSRFAGTLGAVLVLPYALDGATAGRIHAWARGRFGVP
jgi:hypothetical protein